MLLTKMLLTEILLDVTNEEIYYVAKEVHRKAIKGMLRFSNSPIKYCFACPRTSLIHSSSTLNIYKRKGEKWQNRNNHIMSCAVLFCAVCCELTSVTKFLA